MFSREKRGANQFRNHTHSKPQECRSRRKQVHGVPYPPVPSPVSSYLQVFWESLEVLNSLNSWFLESLYWKDTPAEVTAFNIAKTGKVMTFLWLYYSNTSIVSSRGSWKDQINCKYAFLHNIISIYVGIALHIMFLHILFACFTGRQGPSKSFRQGPHRCSSVFSLPRQKCEAIESFESL